MRLWPALALAALVPAAALSAAGPAREVTAGEAARVLSGAENQIARYALDAPDMSALRAAVAAQLRRDAAPEKQACLDRALARGDRLPDYAKALGCIGFDRRSPEERDALLRAILGAGLATLGPSDNAFISLDDIPFASPEETGVIGLHYEVVDGAVRIEKLLHPDPAARTAIPPGAFLATIDGQPVAGLDGAAVARRLRGPVGAAVTLGITGADGATLHLTLTRVDWTVHGPSVASVRQGPTLTLRPWDALAGDAALYYQTPGLIRAELAKHADATQVILDLRGNTGGELQSAIDVADQFLDRVDIGRMEERRDGRIATSERWVGLPGDRGEGAAVTIVVDAGTAAGAELIAAALADNRRARIVGTVTYGRGSVQTLLPLSADYMLKLTTGRLRRPSGGALEDKVVPDCEAAVLPADPAALADAVAALTCAPPQMAAGGAAP